MSTSTWPFRWTLRPEVAEFPTFKTRIVGRNQGIDQRAADFGDDFKLHAVGSLRLPQSSTGKTLADWLAFVEARLGSYDSFLYKADTDRYHVATDSAIGTGDGVTTAFPLIHKHIDASLLVVKKAGVTQTLTTHYTFGGNNTAPTVTFVSAPTAGQAITASYEFYVPVFLMSDGYKPVRLTSKSTDATRNVRIDGVELEETVAGGHLV